MRDASAAVLAWTRQTVVDDLLAQLSGESWLAQALELVVAEIVAFAIVVAWVGEADAGLDDRSVNGAGLQLLVPEEHLSAAAHNELGLASALQVDVAGVARDLEELLLQ